MSAASENRPSAALATTDRCTLRANRRQRWAGKTRPMTGSSSGELNKPTHRSPSVRSEAARREASILLVPHLRSNRSWPPADGPRPTFAAMAFLPARNQGGDGRPRRNDARVTDDPYVPAGQSRRACRGPDHSTRCMTAGDRDGLGRGFEAVPPDLSLRHQCAAPTIGASAAWMRAPCSESIIEPSRSPKRASCTPLTMYCQR